MSLYSLDDRMPQLPEAGKYWIADNASIIGNIVISEDVGIWFGAVLRGDNEQIYIGEGSNIQDQCMLHTDMGFPMTIGKGCTIGHRAILHGCTIEDNSLIGMGATVLNGARIGKNCLIGANALVPENKIIPDNSLVVGMPAKVVRSLDDAAVESLRLSSHDYVRNWKRFAAGLKAI
ncbi:MAG: gamma carbonic anhydrase family protein [Hyphomicrobiales bacterium]